MDENPEPPVEPRTATVECGMCKRRVPIDQTRLLSGRTLCLGCLASWYDEDEE